MALSAILSDILIEGNSIGIGMSGSGVTPTTYTYSTTLSTNADCKIKNNTFSGVTSNAASGALITLLGGSCFMSGNLFIRGSNSLQYYITQSNGASDVTITDNAFDSSTTDGTNIVLANNLSVGSIYSKNKNQIGFSYINPNQLGFYSWNESVLWNYNDAGAQNSGLDLGVLNSAFSIYGEIQIDSIVPKDAQLLYMVAGIGLLSGTGTVGADNNFHFGISIKRPSTFTVGNFSGSIVDVIGNQNDQAAYHQSNSVVLTPSNASTFKAATQYMTVDLTSANVSNNGNQCINMYVSAQFQSASGQFLEVNFSPILVKYTW